MATPHLAGLWSYCSVSDLCKCAQRCNPNAARWLQWAAPELSQNRANLTKDQVRIAVFERKPQSWKPQLECLAVAAAVRSKLSTVAMKGESIELEDEHSVHEEVDFTDAW